MTVELTLPAWASNPIALLWVACAVVNLVVMTALVRRFERPVDRGDHVMIGILSLVVGACGPIALGTALAGLACYLLGRLVGGRIE